MSSLRSIGEIIYPVPALRRSQRSKQMKVLALGLSRSGTDSLRIALNILGYNGVYHGSEVPRSGGAVCKAWADLGRRKWGRGSDNRPITREDFDQLLGHCEATTDQPCACFPLELINAYPEAKVIMNYREPESWHRSIEATFGHFFASWKFRYLFHFDASLYWLRQVFLMYESGYYQGSMIRNGKRIHGEHYAMVRGAVPKDRMLEWTVEDGWEPLCRFLTKPVPNVPFPKGNTPEQLRAKMGQERAAAEQKAYGKMLCIIMLVSAVCMSAVWGAWQ